MESILKIAAVAVAGVLCAAVVKKNAPEIGLAIALAAGILVLTLSLRAVACVRGLMDALANMAGLSPAVLAPVVKTVGIAMMTRITAEICRDAGEGGIAAFVETSGAALALFVTLPLLQAVLTTIAGLL